MKIIKVEHCALCPFRQPKILCLGAIRDEIDPEKEKLVISVARFCFLLGKAVDILVNGGIPPQCPLSNDSYRVELKKIAGIIP